MGKLEYFRVIVGSGSPEYCVCKGHKNCKISEVCGTCFYFDIMCNGMKVLSQIWRELDQK